MTLAIDTKATDERYRFGWYCKDCDLVMFDYMHPYNRRRRSFFSLAGRPDFRCRVCHHCEFIQSEDLHDLWDLFSTVRKILAAALTKIDRYGARDQHWVKR